MTAPLNINLLRYTTSAGAEFYRSVTERVEALPGVAARDASRGWRVLTGGAPCPQHSRRGSGRRPRSDASGRRPGVSPTGGRAINANVVSTGFFETLGIPLVLGRDFTDAGCRERARWWRSSTRPRRERTSPATDPLGRRVSFDGPRGPWREIVGIARDSKYGALERGAARRGVPAAGPESRDRDDPLRAGIGAARVARSPAIRKAIQELEPNLPVPDLPDR